MKTRIIALLTLLAILLPCVVSCGSESQNNFLGVLTENEIAADTITASRADTLEAPELLYDGCTVPYDRRAKQFYLPLSAEVIASGNSGKLTAEGLELYVEALPETTEVAGSVKDGMVYKLLAYNESEYGEFSLVFTALPVMTIELKKPPASNSNPIPETDVEAEMVLFDPGTHTDGKTITIASDAHIRVRGGTSRAFEKKSYKVQLKGSDGKKAHQKYLDLREDDDWILYAIYQEETKLRDRFAMELWQEMSADYLNLEGAVASVSRLRYIEVILNGQYWGMYGLMERIDAKQLGLADDQPLGKISAIYGNEMPTEKQIKDAVKKKSEYAQAIELKNPSTDSDFFSSSWTTLGEFIDFAYYSDDEEFKANVDKFIDRDYFLLYWIYAQFECMGQFKNPYIWQGSDDRFYITPWDFDISLGLNWDGKAPLYHVRDESTITRNNQHIIGKRLIENDIDGSVEKVKQLYAELRGGLLSEESLNARVEELYKHVHDSGAYDRNLARWKKTGQTPDNGREGVEYMQSYFTKRLAFLDELVNSLG